jgi:hypothetical protein
MCVRRFALGRARIPNPHAVEIYIADLLENFSLIQKN